MGIVPSDLAVVTGAGVSGAMPASLPMGQALKNAVLELCHQEATTFVPTIDASELARVKEQQWKLEFVVGRLAGCVGDIAFDVLKTLTLTIPNESHFLLALHILRGGLSITLNFDEGIEIAANLLAGLQELPNGTPAPFVEALGAWRTAAPQVLQHGPIASVVTDDEFRDWISAGCPPALLKLHGSIRHNGNEVMLVAPVVTDEVELEPLNDTKLTALEEVAARSLVVVTGYGGLDSDIYEPLLHCLEKTTWQWVSPQPWPAHSVVARRHKDPWRHRDRWICRTCSSCATRCGAVAIVAVGRRGRSAFQRKARDMAGTCAERDAVRVESRGVRVDARRRGRASSVN